MEAATVAATEAAAAASAYAAKGSCAGPGGGGSTPAGSSSIPAPAQEGLTKNRTTKETAATAPMIRTPQMPFFRNGKS